MLDWDTGDFEMDMVLFADSHTQLVGQDEGHEVPTADQQVHVDGSPAADYSHLMKPTTLQAKQRKSPKDEEKERRS